MLELVNISKSFYLKNEQVKALQSANLTLNPGDFLVIQGPSGCGKTTLLLVAGCLLKPSSGHVLLNGKDPGKMNMKQVNQLRSETIGFVFQQFHLIPYLPVKDNIVSPVLATGKPVDPGHLERLIQQFGLEDRKDHLPHQLSTGQKQRTALARSLCNRPAIILADEPTGNLDEKNSSLIYTYLQQFASEGGSVLLVSHDSMARNYGTSVLEMNNGMIDPVP